jgi:hypothetical protein
MFPIQTFSINSLTFISLSPSTKVQHKNWQQSENLQSAESSALNNSTHLHDNYITTTLTFDKIEKKTQ